MVREDIVERNTKAIFSSGEGSGHCRIRNKPNMQESGKGKYNQNLNDRAKFAFKASKEKAKTLFTNCFLMRSITTPLQIQDPNNFLVTLLQWTVPTLTLKGRQGKARQIHPCFASLVLVSDHLMVETRSH